MPWAMTAHVVYTALDPSAPATTSSVVIEQVIRGAIGFDGVLISDDLCMNALDGPPGRRAEAALAAGCDIALHCNGVLAEMEDVAAACSPLTPAARDRLARAEAMRLRPDAFDVRAAQERLDTLLAADPG
jgi:beta-N-acetylhexosaminidase